MSSTDLYHHETPASITSLPAPLQSKLNTLTRHHQNTLQIHTRIIKNSTNLEKKTLQIAHAIAVNLRNTAQIQEEWQTKKRRVTELWNKVNEVNTRELHLKETDEALVSEMDVLKKLIDHGMQSTGEEKVLMKRLHSEKERLIRLNSEEKTQIVSLLSDVNAYSMKLRRLEADRDEMHQYIDYLSEGINEIQNEIQEYILEKQKAEQSLLAIKRGLDESNAQFQDEQRNFQMNEEEILHQTQILNEGTAKADRASKNVQASNLKLQKVKNTLAKQTYENTLMQSKHDILLKEIADAEHEKNQLKDQLTEMDNKKALHRAARHELEKQSAEFEKQRQTLNRDIKLMKAALDNAKRDAEAQEIRIKDLEHQKRVMEKNLIRNENDFDKQRSIILLYENEKKNLEQKIKIHRDRMEDQRSALFRVEREKDNYAKTDEEAKQRLYRAQEDLLRAQQESQELTQRIEEGKEKQKKNEILRDTVRDERDVYNKNCQKTRDQIEETQKRFKHMLQAITQLKEEITTMDKRLYKKQNIIVKIKKEETKCAERVTQIKNRIKEANNKHDELCQKIEELNGVIRAADKEKNDRRKELESIVNDRDILGRRLIERNDELAALYEKIKLQQSLLNKNSVQFRDRVQQIELVRSKIDDLKNTAAKLQPQIDQIKTLNTEITTLRKELLYEKRKMRALDDELSRPMNVHRWRQLQSTDPAMFEKLKRVQKMQHQLVKLNEDIAKQDIQIQSRENLYKELQDASSKQPGPEMVEQVATYQSTYKKKKKQLQEAQLELKRFQDTVATQKEEMRSVMDQLEDMRREFFKRRTQAEKDAYWKETGGGNDQMWYDGEIGAISHHQTLMEPSKLE